MENFNCGQNSAALEGAVRHGEGTGLAFLAEWRSLLLSVLCSQAESLAVQRFFFPLLSLRAEVTVLS